MRKIVAQPIGKTVIGKHGENEATDVLFQKMSGLNASLIVTRNGDTHSSPRVTEVSGNNIVWTVNSWDTDVVGDVLAEVDYTDESGTVVKSATYTFEVVESLGTPSETVPDPYEDWYADILAASQEAKKAEEGAVSARDGAEAAEDAAKNAETGAESAKTAAEEAESAAKNSASSASSSATNAGKSATSATESASKAKSSEEATTKLASDAAAAKDKAEAAADTATNKAAAASDSATAAAKSEKNAESYAKSASGSATSAANGATNAGNYANAAALSAAAASGYEADAQAAKNAADAAKTAAETASANAVSSASSASSSATAASGSASTATTKAGEASSSATAAAKSAETASTKAEDAAKSAEEAKQDYDTEKARAEAAESQLNDDLADKADKTALASTDRSLSALWKLNEGQTYEFEEQTESGVNVAPTGAKFETVEEVYGKSTQDTTNGYQLIDTFPGWTKTVSGVTVVNTGYGKFKVSGTNTSDSTASIWCGYQMSTGISETFTIQVSMSVGLLGYSIGSIGTFYKDISATYSDKTNFTCGINIYVPAGTTVDEEVTMMVEKGSTAHSYEPYTGGIASPNPDYPQEITDVTQEVFTVTAADGTQTTHTMSYTLRGIGDVHDVLSAEGITRNIGTVDMGSIPWKYAAAPYSGNPNVFYTNVTEYTAAMCVNYGFKKITSVSEMSKDKAGYYGHTFYKTAVVDTDYTSATAFTKAVTGTNLIYQAANFSTDTISTEDAEYLASLDTLSTDYTISVVDQNGNDISYLVEYIVKLSEVG